MMMRSTFQRAAFSITRDDIPRQLIVLSLLAAAGRSPLMLGAWQAAGPRYRAGLADDTQSGAQAYRRADRRRKQLSRCRPLRAGRRRAALSGIGLFSRHAVGRLLFALKAFL